MADQPKTADDVKALVEDQNVRFIRLRQSAADAHGWSIVELRVIR